MKGTIVSTEAPTHYHTEGFSELISVTDIVCAEDGRIFSMVYRPSQPLCFWDGELDETIERYREERPRVMELHPGKLIEFELD